MNISIGSSSSSFSSERSESSPRRAHHRHHHHNNNSAHQHSQSPLRHAGTEVPGLHVDDLLAQPLTSRADGYKSAHSEAIGNAVEVMHSTHNSNKNNNNAAAEEGESGAHSFSEAATAVIATTTATSSSNPSVSARQPSEDMLYALPSRESISPRYTPSNSMPYNPSFTTSSVPPPPLPPSPQAMGLYYSEAPFQMTMARALEALPAAPKPPSSSSPSLAQEDAQVGNLQSGVVTDSEKGYLRVASLPADPSSPPHSPLHPSTSAKSPSDVFARTESPSPLKQKKRSDGAEASTSASKSNSAAAAAACAGGPREGSQLDKRSRGEDTFPAHLDAPEITRISRERTGSVAGDRYEPLHIPVLTSVNDRTAGTASSEVDFTSGEVRGLSEASESVTAGRPGRYSTSFLNGVAEPPFTAPSPLSSSASAAAGVFDVVAEVAKRRESTGDKTTASSSVSPAPARAPPPLPRPIPTPSATGAQDTERVSTAASTSSLSRLPSRSADSAAHSLSRPRAAESRHSRSRAGGSAAAHSEDWASWQDGCERGPSASEAEHCPDSPSTSRDHYSVARPPPHAPTLHAHHGDVDHEDADHGGTRAGNGGGDGRSREGTEGQLGEPAAVAGSEGRSSAGAPTLLHGEGVPWRLNGTSASQPRSHSRSDRRSQSDQSLRHGEERRAAASAEQDEDEEAARVAREEAETEVLKRLELQMREKRSAERHFLSTSSSSLSSSSSVAAAGEPSRTPVHSAKSECTASSSKGRSKSSSEVAQPAPLHTSSSMYGGGPAQPDVTRVPAASAISSTAITVEEEVAEADVSSIALTTPADTALSSNVGAGLAGVRDGSLSGQRQEGVRYGGSGSNSSGNVGAVVVSPGGNTTATASTSRSDKMGDESPPPLPPAPWKGVVPRDVHSNAVVLMASRSGKAVETKTNVVSTAAQPPSLREVSALDRWRSGGTAEAREDATSASTPHASPSPSSSAVAPVKKSLGKATAPVGSPAVPPTHDANIYRGGVDFVRWVPSSVGRDADLSGTSLTPPRAASRRSLHGSTDLRGAAHPSTKHASEDFNNSTGTDASSVKKHADINAAARVVAVPLVPSPHRLPQRTSSTSAVLAEVAQRRASTSPVPGGVTTRTTPNEVRSNAVDAAAAAVPVARQRLRLSAITSPQLTREAKRLDRAYVEGHAKASAPAGHSEPRATHRDALSLHEEMRSSSNGYGGRLWGGPAADAWTQQPSGRFLTTSKALSSYHNEDALPLSTNKAVIETTSEDVERAAAVAKSSLSSQSHLDNWGDASGGNGGGQRRLELDAALASRNQRATTLSGILQQQQRQQRGGALHNNQNGAHDSKSESCSDINDASDVPTVVRAWRPLSAVVYSSQLGPRRRTGREGHVPEASLNDADVSACGWAREAAPTAPPPPAHAALSIDVSDSTRPSSILSVRQTGDSFLKETPEMSAVAPVNPLDGNEYCPLTRRQSEPAQVRSTAASVTPGYLAIYSPRPLATRVLQARDTLLLGASRATPLFCGSATTITDPLNPARAMVKGGSRMMPAIGAAVSVAASSRAQQANVAPPTPPRVRVDLSHTPVQAPPVSDVLSNSYDDTNAVAQYAAQNNAEAQQQGERAAAEPWSLFLERDSGYVEPADFSAVAHRNEAPVSATTHEGVARRIPFGASGVPAPSHGAYRLEKGSEHTSVAGRHTHAQQQSIASSQHTQGVRGPHDFFEGSGYEPPSHARASQHRSALEELRGMEKAQAHLEYSQPQFPAQATRNTFHTQHANNASGLTAPNLQDRRSSAAVSAVSSLTTASTSPSQPSVHSRFSDHRSASTAEPPPRPSNASTVSAASSADSHDAPRLRAAAERNVRQTHVVEQQRLMQEEAFRRRQIVMQEDHTFSIELTELNYRRAVTYVQRAAAAGAVAAATSAAAYDGSHHKNHWMNSVQDVGGLVGLSAVREDQAAMAASLGELSRELDSMSF